jgi:hypothetical protein
MYNYFICLGMKLWSVIKREKKVIELTIIKKTVNIVNKAQPFNYRFQAMQYLL